METYIKWAYLSIISGVFYHMVIKKMSLDGYDHNLILIWLHVVMLLFLSFDYWRYHKQKETDQTFSILTDPRFVLLALVGGFLSYINHHYGYEAFLKFRNPGYYQALLTMELVIITILAVFFFGSHLGTKEIIGISFISVGSIIITWSENKASLISP